SCQGKNHPSPLSLDEDGSVSIPDAATTTTNPHPGTGGGSSCFMDDVTGIPKCSWRAMKDGDTVSITGVASDGSTTDFTLRAFAPTKCASQDDCKVHTFGFRLEKAGIDETMQPDEGASWLFVDAGGAWTFQGDGGVLGMAMAYDPTISHDAGAPDA